MLSVHGEGQSKDSKTPFYSTVTEAVSTGSQAGLLRGISFQLRRRHAALSIATGKPFDSFAPLDRAPNEWREIVPHDPAAARSITGVSARKITARMDRKGKQVKNGGGALFLHWFLSLIGRRFFIRRLMNLRAPVISVCVCDFNWMHEQMGEFPLRQSKWQIAGRKWDESCRFDPRFEHNTILILIITILILILIITILILILILKYWNVFLA